MLRSAEHCPFVRDAGREKRTRFLTTRTIKNVVIDDILAIEPDARAKNGIPIYLGIPDNA
jgi:hypothetical protein